MDNKFKVGDQIKSEWHDITGTVTALFTPFTTGKDTYPAIQVKYPRLCNTNGKLEYLPTLSGFLERDFELTGGQ